MAISNGSSLRDVLVGVRQQVLDRFLQEVEERKLAPCPLPRHVILDHIPELMDEVIGRLEKSAPREAEGTFGEIESAREHASARWEAHYDLSMMVREYGAIRDAIVDVTEQAGAHITLRDFNILSNWITVGVAEAVNEYNRHQDEQLRIQTARAEAERRRLDAILQILPVGLVISDAEGRLVRTNDADERIWGNTAEADHTDSPAWKPADGVRVQTEQRALRRSLRTGEVVMHEEVEAVSPDGIAKTILVSSAPIRDPDTGVIVGAVGINVDITERKRMLRRAEAAVSVRDEVVAVVSHDLRDPLGVIAGNATYIDRMMSRPNIDVAAIRQRLGTIHRATARMERLISDLLDVTRIEEGKLPLEMGEHIISDVVRGAVEDLRPIAAEKSIELSAEIQTDERVLRCDRNRVLQVLSNLVGNAVKSTPNGGSITLGVEDLRREYRFFVRDTGSGIHEKQLPHIFDRFWRVRDPAQDRKGAGLGLTIAKGIVEAHGGRIWAESAIGKGTTVYFTLPSHAPPIELG